MIYKRKRLISKDKDTADCRGKNYSREFKVKPELAKCLKLRPDKGRPSIETDQLDILKTLLALHGASMHENTANYEKYFFVDRNLT